jgi:hypothetical protein
MSQTRPERAVRSSSRFAGVTRVGLRVVVVAGIAGAAWALSASAANAAADPSSTANATIGSQIAPLTSLTSLVSNVSSVLGTGVSAHAASPTAQHTTAQHATAKHATAEAVGKPVGNVVTSSVTPLLSTGGGLLSQVLAPTKAVLSSTGTARSHDSAASAGGATSTAVSRHTVAAQSSTAGRDTIQVPASMLDRPQGVELNDEAGAGSTDLVGTITNLVAPLGLDQILPPTLDVLQPMIGVIDPLTAPLDQLLDFVDGVSTPIFDAVSAEPAPVADIVTRSTDGAAPGAKPAGPVVTSTGEAPLTAATPVRVDDGTLAKRAIVRHGTRGTPASRSSRFGSDQHHAPMSPARVPALPAPSSGGISTTASGSHEAGGCAVLFVPVVRGADIQLRISRATGFAVRRLIVENPTVSPD